MVLRLEVERDLNVPILPSMTGGRGYIVALLGVDAVGKDEVAEYFEKRWGFVRISAPGVFGYVRAILTENTDPQVAFCVFLAIGFAIYGRALVEAHKGNNVVMVRSPLLYTYPLIRTPVRF